MKDARIILSMVREVCPNGVFPGRNGEQVAEWPPDPFHVLISTVLSQRTKDANTYAASAALFRFFNSPKEISRAPLSRIKELIRPAGFPEAKARAIKEIGRRVHEEMGDVVPDDMEALLTFPMVGRKTANCVRAYAFHIPSICVDTHVHRISNRIGLVSTKDPEGTEAGLSGIVPEDLWIDVNSLLVRFGQTICLPRNPRCGSCPVSMHCDFFSRLHSPPPSAKNLRKGPRRDPKA
ncbi:MAG: endonuclease III [Methanomassiliicoccales archaeon]|nr:endonuclease III [Methanomassiliicoccales archaeon]MDD1755592.1 endonuclease III [Methanomassiliicoccales archaeon]